MLYSIFAIINKIIYKNDSAQYHQNYIFVQALKMYKMEDESQKVKEVRGRVSCLLKNLQS